MTKKSPNVVQTIGLLKALIELAQLLDGTTWGLHYGDDIVIDELERPLEQLLDNLPMLKQALVELEKLQ